ncbi:MAG: 3-dehydroquinate synthase [Nitrospirota bacterium]|nr:3-dehydroquinate synthase [Nitrospirota bacterium]
MEKVRVELGERSYDITIAAGTLGGIGPAMKELSIGRRVAVVTNPTVGALYEKTVVDSLKTAGFSPITITVPDGEKYKTLESAATIYERLLTEKFDRKCSLVALGGGVIGDLTGFVAATYLRGVPFVQVPTTLLAQVDSSVGGKTGVNHPLGKNMIGAFYQPLLVWIDTATLTTLPPREFIAGLAEVVKYGVISDKSLFDYLEEAIEDILALREQDLTRIIKRSCEIKAEVVGQDERESGLRAILNYGHTVGHAIETATGYTRYLHGEAVAIGMIAAARLAVALGRCDKSVTSRIEALLHRGGLPVCVPSDLPPRQLVELTGGDKKAVEKKARFILPSRIGQVDITDDWDETTLESVLRPS